MFEKALFQPIIQAQAQTYMKPADRGQSQGGQARGTKRKNQETMNGEGQYACDNSSMHGSRAADYYYCW